MNKRKQKLVVTKNEKIKICLNMILKTYILMERTIFVVFVAKLTENPEESRSFQREMLIHFIITN